MRSLLKLLLFAVLTLSFSAHAQSKKPKSVRESERKARRSRDSVFQTLNKADTSINSLLQRTEQYISSFNQINNSLAQGLDTSDVSQQMASVSKRLDKIQTQINTKKSST